MNMRRAQVLGLTFCTLIMGWGAMVASEGAPRQRACAEIRAACQQAGFVQGGGKDGDGILIDCIRPIVQGTGQRRRASKPLPQVDPQLVAACKEENPRFAQRNVPAQSVEPAAPPPAAPPPAVTAQAAPVDRTGPKRPNFVFILTDDLASNLVQYMPHVLEMQKAGATFANYFVTNSLCCPSRSSIFTGRYPHNTGIYKNQGEDGGYNAFRNRGHEQTTFAISLSKSGYRTAMLGKYLNGYQPGDAVSPGWTSWFVAGGGGYREFNYRVNQDGRALRYGNRPEDYLTDVLNAQAVSFIKASAGAPFFIEIATFAPHGPFVPAPRDANAYPEVRAPRTGAYNAAPDPNGPKWLLPHPELSAADMARIDQAFRKRVQSVLAIDKMIADLQAAVAAAGEADNTYFIFSSDNGFHMGEHRLMPGKMTAFDTDIRVPLVIVGPRVAKGRTIAEIAENIDLHSTFVELAGATPAPAVDGHSLVPLILGQAADDWRTLALIEHRGGHRAATEEDPDAPTPRGGNPPTYSALRARDWVYVEYSDGSKEYHDRTSDPDELRNTFVSLPGDQQAALGKALAVLKTCQGAQSCWAAEHMPR
jgi:N-acetylglucosamine-6-sulfatase